jgi:hypothetical protein
MKLDMPFKKVQMMAARIKAPESMLVDMIFLFWEYTIKPRINQCLAFCFLAGFVI